MIIRYTVIKDPLFKGTWENYSIVVSNDINEHLETIKSIVLSGQPKGTKNVIFFSVPDAIGIRFMRITEDLDEGRFWIMSDFRFEWS